MERCRKCGVILRVGVNITQYRLDHANYICKKCWKEYMGKWYKRKREKWRLYLRDYLRDKRKEILKTLGIKCKLCNKECGIQSDKLHKRFYHFHEKSGGKHDNHAYYVLSHLEDFVLLCPRCHKGVHWLMDIFNLKWGEIENMVKL